MASENDTVAEISREQREFAVQVYGVNTAPSTKVWKLADRIEAAHKCEVEGLRVEIAELRKCLKVAEDALEKIDNMCDGDLCKFFDTTHHCSACRYLEKCQTGVAHAALHEIRVKGGNNGK